MSESLEKLFIDELKDIYNAEKQITRALPKMAKSAESPELQQAFTKHLKETEGQIQRRSSRSLRPVSSSYWERPEASAALGRS